MFDIPKTPPFKTQSSLPDEEEGWEGQDYSTWMDYRKFAPLEHVNLPPEKYNDPKSIFMTATLLVSQIPITAEGEHIDRDASRKVLRDLAVLTNVIQTSGAFGYHVSGAKFVRVVKRVDKSMFLESRRRIVSVAGKRLAEWVQGQSHE